MAIRAFAVYWVRVIIITVLSLPFAVLLDHQAVSSLPWWLPVRYIGAHPTLALVFLACAGRFADGISTIMGLRAPGLEETAPSLSPSPSPNRVWSVVFGQIVIIAGISIVAMPHVNHAPLRVILLTIAIVSLEAAVSNILLLCVASGKTVGTWKEYEDADSGLAEREDRIDECINRVTNALRSHRKPYYHNGILDEETKKALREIPGLSDPVYDRFGLWYNERSWVSGVLRELHAAKLTVQSDRADLTKSLDRQTTLYPSGGFTAAAHGRAGLHCTETTPQQRASSMALAMWAGGQLIADVTALPIAIGLVALIGVTLPTDSYSLHCTVTVFLLSVWSVYGYRLWRAPSSPTVASERDGGRRTPDVENTATEQQVRSVSDRVSKPKAAGRGRKKRAPSHKRHPGKGGKRGARRPR